MLVGDDEYSTEITRRLKNGVKTSLSCIYIRTAINVTVSKVERERGRSNDKATRVEGNGSVGYSCARV